MGSLIKHPFRNYKVFVGQDYGQMEIRVMAHMSNDKEYIKLFKAKKDIHAMVGSMLTGRPFEEIQKDEDVRAMIKALHFSMVYGKKPKGIHAGIIADQLKSGKKLTKLEDVELYYQKYFERFEGVKELIEELIASVEETGFVENMLGFRREIPKVSESGAFWQNQAVNTPVQGAAHQILLIGLAVLYLKPKTYWTFEDLIMEVHDALYTRVRLKHLQEHYKQGQELLQETIPQYLKKWFGIKFRVPLEAEAKVGFRMGVMVKYKGESIDEFLDKWREENKSVEAKVRAQLKKYKSHNLVGAQ